MPAFVLEIGTEELPARFLADAEKELVARLQTALTESGVVFTGMMSASTPRRLTVFINEVAEQAQSREETIMGPPVKAAYDVGGRPTKAAEGFAKTHSVDLADTFTVETEKGGYLAVRKNTGGGATCTLLQAVCAQIIQALPFPKRMHWADPTFTFARPLRWILCLLGDAVVPFTVGPVQSGNITKGHRIHGPGPFLVTRAGEYFNVIENQCGIVLENEKRLDIIRNQGTELALAKGGIVLWKESLLHEVQGLCEHPVPILGGFDQSFLEVPREVLLTSMESHQKSFGLQANDGRLLPYFLTVLNTMPEDIELVRKGWERVLRARLEDARFFWKTDLQSSFDAWGTSLHSVVFLAPLGSMGEKAHRISRLCSWLARACMEQDSSFAVTQEDATRAGLLAKADLVSEMVKEFDTLQGIMGGIYATKAGENTVVATAIAEQYLPAGPETPVPGSLCGALVSIADKADTLASCFGLNMIPTGTADPYALRRAVLGIVRIMIEKQLRFDVMALLQEAISSHGAVVWKQETDKTLARLQTFVSQRLKNYFMGTGHETLFVESCLRAGIQDPWAVGQRIKALEQFAKSPDFEATALTFKRLVNIIRKQEESSLHGAYDHALITDKAEQELALAFEAFVPQFDAMGKQDDFGGQFTLIGKLRPAVDTFFDSVMVMCDDLHVRQNRLKLLKAMVDKFSLLADFSALQM